MAGSVVVDPRLGAADQRDVAAHETERTAFRKLWQGQPQRKLSFRYGYLSGHQAHLLVTKKPAPAP